MDHNDPALRGYVYVVDRIKDMIISGGENVHSIEVENVVARHPAIAQMAVIGLPGDRWGERVHAVVALKPGSALDLGELRVLYEEYRPLQGTAQRGGRDPFPLSGAGRILKRTLREQHQ